MDCGTCDDRRACPTCSAPLPERTVPWWLPTAETSAAKLAQSTDDGPGPDWA